MKAILVIFLLTAVPARAATLRIFRAGPDVWVIAQSTGKPIRLEFSTDGRRWHILERHPRLVVRRAGDWFRGFYPVGFYRVVEENSDYRRTVEYK